MTGAVSLDIVDGIGLVTLRNGAQRNAITGAMAAQIGDICDRVEDDASVGAVVVVGEGGYFCAGGSREELASISADPLTDANTEALSTIYSAFTRIGRLPVPTVAAVRGGALGAGLNLALAADVRVVANDAVIESGFTRLGVHPGGGHYHLLLRTVGRQAAVALGLLGQSIDGHGAVHLGLAWESCADADVDARAMDLVRRAATDPALTRKATVSMTDVAGPPAMTWESALQAERAPQLWSFARKGGSAWTAREASGA
jgi:enoyl-CoA hydratase